MPVDLIRSPDLTDAAPYAYASVVSAGSLVFTAGACPLDADGDDRPARRRRRPGGPGDGEPRHRARRRRASLTDVAKTTVYVATSDRADLTAAWEVVRAAFGDHDAPSTLLSVPVLGGPGQLVEVEAVAAVQSAPTAA